MDDNEHEMKQVAPKDLTVEQWSMVMSGMLQQLLSTGNEKAVFESICYDMPEEVRKHFCVVVFQATEAANTLDELAASMGEQE
jgi:hypothetical protein